jgi:AcrR family transcriptional regulator
MSKTTARRPYRMVRRLEQSEATAARLLDAAWQRFSTLPYESVRVHDVAADAGVTVQTLHTRFGTKEGLFTVAFQRWMAEQGSRRVHARVGDVDDVVRVLYDNYDDQGAIGLRMIAQEDRIPIIRIYTDAGRRWQRRWVAQVFEPPRPPGPGPTSTRRSSSPWTSTRGGCSASTPATPRRTPGGSSWG